ncbi:hypothetical protein FOMPIDRAFT_1056768 [Fomitopsis schrenkii]|uniref:Uncharacterized protein n=1 Tax=Fomitopsis schrenkii TaxID=2126942 RepID=S8ERX8_FOMSC|nr:hypothetical protein FOMPIDRAFT_1056768 [Fomitopsis schrenkii]
MFCLQPWCERGPRQAVLQKSAIGVRQDGSSSAATQLRQAGGKEGKTQDSRGEDKGGKTDRMAKGQHALKAGQDRREGEVARLKTDWGLWRKMEDLLGWAKTQGSSAST